MSKYVKCWHLLCCLMVLLMVMLGGFTRLSGSGLSIIEWKPITGIVPPFSENSWKAEKLKYEMTPDYRMHQYSMEQFKFIFWVEFLHRAIGRLTGLVFIVPFVFFLFMKELRKDTMYSSAFAAVLCVVQGAMGWYMVKSGLIDSPHVSHIRLMLHLVLALCLFYLPWRSFAYQLKVNVAVTDFTHLLGKILACLVAIQVAFGALTAGSGAGLIYNTFPLMGKTFFPEELLQLTLPDVLANPACIQFIHRIVGVIILLFAIHLALSTRHIMYYCLCGLVIFQVFLGITTLLSYIAIIPALLHQSTAFLVFANTTLCVTRSKKTSQDMITLHNLVAK